MIVTVGEVVWDIFSDRRILGGAPVNVGYHLSRLGLDVRVITRVGDDPLGKETIACLHDLSVSTEGIQRDASLPTGEVHVTVDEKNEPHFDIAAPAAWDNINLDEAMNILTGGAFHLLFGSLAQRDERSRTAIRGLWEKASYCYYDVNLRPPFTGEKIVLESLTAAQVVKMNLKELHIVSSWLGIDEKEKRDKAEKLVGRYHLDALVVTEGEEGAWVLTPEGFFHDRGEPIAVADTVGAGDAFFAAMIEGIERGRPWRESLARANRRAGYVAARRGATPPMPEE